MKNLKPSNIKLKSSLESIISLRLDSNLSYHPCDVSCCPGCTFISNSSLQLRRQRDTCRQKIPEGYLPCFFLIDIGSLLIWFLISRTCTGKEAVTVRGMVFDHGCFFCQADVEENVLGCGHYPNSVLEPFPPPNS